jgi:hypothetical protein
MCNKGSQNSSGVRIVILPEKAQMTHSIQNPVTYHTSFGRAALKSSYLIRPAHSRNGLRNDTKYCDNLRGAGPRRSKEIGNFALASSTTQNSTRK